MKLSPPIRPSNTEAATSVAPPRQAKRPGLLRRMGSRLHRWRWFMLFVLLPTAIVGSYYAFYASDLYETEARFIVRARQTPSGGGSISAITAMLGGGASNVSTEQRAVEEFIDSVNAVSQLRDRVNVVEMWRRPEADLIAKLWFENPEAERLHQYYRRRVSVFYDMETGVTRLSVLAFRPEDSREIAEQLLQLSEELVNRLSARTQADTLRVARAEVEVAERRVLEARERVTAFREREHAMDPTRSAAAALESIAKLEGALAQTRAELQERQSYMRADNPQVQMLRNRVTALVAQITEERARLTQGQEALPQQINAYERLQIERGFADQALTSAYASLEAARVEAARQQMFLARVVEPSLAEHALYPKGLFNTATVFVALLVAFGIGWLLVAGAREHNG